MKTLVFVLLLLPCLLFSQVESFVDMTVGGGADYTNQPVSMQSDYSHSQTLYYPDQLQFRGTINEIRFFTVFSGTIISNSSQWIVKLGHTNQSEFLPGDNFIPSSELTEVFNGYVVGTSGYDVIVAFSQPFVYDGTQNLVLDIEEITPGHSSSALAGFQGAENFGNPPTRSIMSLTTDLGGGNTSTSILRENSYAKTKFIGNLERCIRVNVSSVSNITTSTADVTLVNDPNVTNYRYVITEQGEAIPNSYATTTSTQFALTDLLAAQRYVVNVKSDCDEIYSNYRPYAFITRPVRMTVPYTIDFDGTFNRDYIRSNDFLMTVDTEAANNSTNGLLMAGPSYVPATWSDFGNPFVSNPAYITKFIMEADLTANASNPVLTFDIKQTGGANVRVKVNGFVKDFVYNTSTSENTFRTVSVDLSSNVGSIVLLEIEHVARNQARKTYMDFIQLKENDCELVTNLNTTASLNSINTQWDTSTSQWEVVHAEHSQLPPNTFNITNTSAYNIENLNVATAYDIYVRSLCASSNSPWKKTIASTDPNPITAFPFFQYFNSASLNNGFFAPQHNQSTDITVPNGFRVALHQKYTESQWVGGATTTESQAWNENNDFVTGMKYKIDATNMAILNMALRFKLTHHYQSTPTNSWFRILVNGVQFGQSYNPMTKNSDPITTLNIDLSSYSGTIFDIVLQQSGRSYEFSGGGVSGDGTIIYDLDLTGTVLGLEEAVLANAVKLYPNPALSVLNIQSAQPLTAYIITDINGRLITQQQFKSNSPLNYKLDVGDLSQGVYFIEVSTDVSKQTLKFVKE